MIWSGTSPITRALPPLPRDREISAPASIGPTWTVRFTHSGTSVGGISPTGRPRFSTSSGTKRVEVGEHEDVGPAARARSPRGALRPW